MSDAREISLPQQLWETLDTMAKEMGVARDSLVSQAVFTLARLNGYVIPGKVVLAQGNGAVAPVKARSETKGAVPAASLPAKAKGRPTPQPEPEPEPDAP